ncbi:HET-domain-containing protein [Didymella exigua CBS 183.55]|uniref:HET-domain-containing protein n=1 Tax=Didymella exigua CBS 183.55 TaxID=1150837 RepID=A0A6A5S5P3_9PLEO|nr:HET-domain-containing protein [Didymella exigua CBS 183.55]KAF1933816.1 HET-domain-containing protein [Didymella exigua CBS 183.55]
MAECRHPDIQRFGEIRCCLSCGEAVFEVTTSEPPLESSPQYRYKPLRHGLGHEIRLIVLFAGEPSDDLSCDITTVNLADRPSYEAVSYTWANSRGHVSLTSEIRCGGSTIAITENCEAALRRLRLRGRNRRLWIDAICIHQNDTEEKSHQVKLMSTIYSNAAQVLAYLGVESPQVTRQLRGVLDFLQDKTGVITSEPCGKENLLTFLHLPYFDRVWIMQEIGLAQLVTLIIGDYEVRWTGDTVSRTLDMCSQLDLRPPSVLRWTPSSRPEEQNDILAVLSKSRNCSAGNPRDKIYALLGLMDSRFSAEFVVDYSLSHTDVFAKLATYCIEKLGRFDILQHCQHVSDPDRHWQNTTRIPSWIPQWDYRHAYEPLPAHFTAVEKQAFASSWHMAPTNPAGLPPRLKLRAHRLDYIVRLIGPTAKHRTPTLPRIAWSALGVPDCQTCTGSKSAPAQCSPAPRAAFQQHRQAVLSALSAAGPGATVFASTHSVGYTHARPLVGDTVWALYGSDVPFVMRLTAGHHELVGACYLSRAGRPFVCQRCGAEAAPWPMQTHIVDIW